MRKSGSDSHQFLGCPGEMAQRMAVFDWSKTSLGSVDSWPPSLKAAIRIALRSRFAMWMCWGADLTFFCNDAYLPTLGVKSEWALGASARQVWEEIWPDIGPRIDQVLDQGIATWDEGLKLYLERSGMREETYHTFSYSPLTNDDGEVYGMLCVVTEETARVINEQRVRLLSGLANALNTIFGEQQMFERARTRLENDPSLVPAAFLYVSAANAAIGDVLNLAMALNGNVADLAEVDRRIRVAWPLADVLTSETSSRRPAKEALRDMSVHSAAGQPIKEFVLMPLKGQGGALANGVFVAALNPDQPYNRAYEDFLKLLSGQLAASLASVRAYEAERGRAAQLAELDAAKTVFFSNISHEFRTPLTLMLGPTEAALDSPERVLAGADLELVHRNELRLLKLVNALLDFSRIEAGRFDVNREPTDLAILTAELASVFESAAAQAGLRLTIDCLMPHAVAIDRDMWEKIVLNLLSNAFKHTAKGIITVTLRGDGRDAVLTVTDTGSGIPADALPHIFERFKRVHGTARRTHEGTGIGLALVRELVLLLEGDVTVDSELGRGTTFTVSVAAPRSELPTSQASPRSRAASAYAGEAGRWGTPAVPEPASGTNGQRLQVLVADDNGDMRGYIARLLRERFDVLEATDGKGALDLIRSSRPSLVLSDVMMPVMDGFELLRAVRGDMEIAATPILLLSARSGEEARIEGLAAGADDYMTKPFSARELVARVSGVLALAEARKESQRTEGLLIRERDSVLESINDGFLLVDADWRIRRINRSAERLLSTTAAQIIGRYVWKLYPEIAETAYGKALQLTMQERVPQVIENFYEPWERWYEVSLYPHGDTALAVYFRDITEHRKALEALYDADRRKDEFLATLAHELRNPLAPIRNAASILENRALTAEAVQQTAAILHRQIHHMARLLDDLLDVSRITTGKLVLKLESVSMAQIVETAVETVRALVDARGHQMTVLLEPDLPNVHGDAVRLTQVLTNLLTNAAKYTEASGLINLAVTHIDDRVRIEVKDNGLGLDASQQAGIFEMFSQVNTSLERAQGGLGIGLALARGIVGLHGGKIEVHSEGLGKGSRFVVFLPSGSQGPATTAAEISIGQSPSRCRRILVVDDNRDAADTMAMIFQIEGHKVKAVYGGHAALAAATEFRPDIAFIDIGMPDMSGYRVATVLRQQSSARLKLIALTGYGREEDQRKAILAGFDRHLTKPADTAQLLSIVDSLDASIAFKIGSSR